LKLPTGIRVLSIRCDLGPLLLEQPIQFLAQALRST
jgi:hypothetical protein